MPFAVSNFTVRMILIVVAIIVLVVLITQYQKKKSVVVSEEAPRSIENFENITVPSLVTPTMPSLLPTPISTTQSVAAAPALAATSGDIRPHETPDNEDYKAVDFDTENKIPTDCFPRDKLTVEDLLPKDAANSTWAQVNPAGQGDVKDQNFLTAGFHVGVNTVGQSLRNPNLQLRSDPPNPKMKVSPWNQSTIEYDASRRYFEVGEC